MKYRYCPKCAASLSLKKKSLEERPRLVCRQCGYVFYQNPKPTVSAVIYQDQQLLLVKRAIRPKKGWWDITGGFIEIDEHPLTAIKREAKEELGVEIKIEDFIGIYGPTRYPHQGEVVFNLDIFYLATIKSGRVRPASDVAAARWFSLKKIPEKIAFSSVKQALQEAIRMLEPPAG